MTLSTHVLDTARGLPASGVAVEALKAEAGSWRRVGAGVTDDDGRLGDVIGSGQEIERGTYRLVFDTAAYFAATGVQGFYPEVTIAFEVADTARQVHVPLLLSPFGYSTYRGS